MGHAFRNLGLRVGTPITYLILDWKEFAFREAFGKTGVTAQVAGLFYCCGFALYAYTGTELLAITSWETESPRFNLPKAVRRVSHRIVLYYLGAIFILGLTVSADDQLLTRPIYVGGFVIMAQRAGIPVVPGLINLVMVIATISVGIIDIYVTVYSTYNLAKC